MARKKKENHENSVIPKQENNDQWLDGQLSNLNVPEEKLMKKFICKYCKGKLPHMVVMLNKDGDVHVHAPFENDGLMKDFLMAIHREYRKYKET